MSTRKFEQQEKAFEDAIASRYNRDYHEYPIMKKQDRDFVAYTKQHYHEGDRVLDMGCGAASLWEYWKREFESPGCLIGVDISEGMIGECKKLYPDGDFRIGSLFELPVEAGTVDLLIASSVLHHIPNEHLPNVFKELHRVLDEHGVIVGREPVGTGRLGDTPGWFSGTFMNFRHMLYRLTHTREYPEPEIGGHHHAFAPKEFFALLGETFSQKGIKFKHPVSSYVLRINNPLVSKVVGLLDSALNHKGGHEFYYTAAKNYADAADVAYCIENELAENTISNKEKKEFMALLQSASEFLERELKR